MYIIIKSYSNFKMNTKITKCEECSEKTPCMDYDECSWCCQHVKPCECGCGLLGGTCEEQTRKYKEEDTESVESHDELDDHGVMCHYSRKTGGWEAIEPFCQDCGFLDDNCECIIRCGKCCKSEDSENIYDYDDNTGLHLCLDCVE